MSKTIAWAVAGIFALALIPGANAKPRIRFGGFVVSAGYGYGGYPYWSPLWSPLCYDPWFYGFAPFVYPGYFGGYSYGPDRGHIKLQSSSKNAAVYLNGGYAGEVSKLQSIWLDPGVYELEIRDGSRPFYQRRIYVLSGKTLRIRAPEK